MTIESGPDGAVFGVTFRGIVYTRRGITKKNPTGTAWRPVGKKLMSSISVGLGFVYAVGRRGAPFSSDVAKLVGPAGIPRKPGKPVVPKPDCGWTKMKRKFTVIDTGITRTPWAVNKRGNIFTLLKGKWIQVPGGLSHID
ncbi:tectonin beta-propeller repeat-containing protein 1-like [Dendronephthya gigantea]|uniref:tectonin beta-propeller repeat-containing protein 1-like n=1 Tax=Dendronephthya gigantea TaxID=151771 RepID=UPI00106C7354|nr:tectonin beta-propeller repeat-containing protein 1-like [Dendronephthya gigantea]